ncbi:hypothetical protein GW17_00028743, partial [Ensete ventricosum]
LVSSLDRRRQFWTPMAAAAAATAAALTVLLCLLLCMREGAVEEGVAGDASDGVVLERHRSGGRWRKRQQSPTEPPVTWMGKLALVVGTIRFTFSETLGRWPLVDLLFGIKHHMRRQVSDYVLLIGRICSLSMAYLRVASLLFIKLLKPAFTILRDRNSKSFLLVIRGALSIKDKLTAATGELVPFHHLVSHEGSICNLITGYAHCGMVAAAHWIAKCATPCLLKAVNEYPDYNIKAPQVVIGHAQHVAHAVVTCRSSVSCWSDMTLNRQAFGTRTSPDEEEAPGSLGTHTRPVNCLQASGCEEILEDQKLLQVNHICKAASVEEMSEGEFWLEIEKELHHHHEDMQGLEKEKEESMLLIEAMEKEPPTTPNAQKEHQLYPPGKLLHMVAVPALDHSDTLEDALNNRSIGIYETQRELYGKIRLSQTMIDDHYMPRYKRMIELLIDKLRRDNDGYATAI